ncbi:MAG: hypothetical protein OSA95_03665 [Opitutales bacterium]|nr:hypothetical protein [Opitutales bacterium]
MSTQLKSHSEILCRLHLYAVLPALDDLLKNTTEAKKILGERSFSISVSIHNGPKAILSFKDGRCLVNETRPQNDGIHFFFRSPDHLNRLMQGRPVLPAIEFTTFQPGNLIVFLRLLNLLRKYLRPRDLPARDAQFRANHVRLLLGIAFFGLKQLAEHEEASRRRILETPYGLALFSIENENLAAWASWDGVDILAGKGEPEHKSPDVIITFKDATIAYQALTEKLDPMASIGLHLIQTRGLLPLADGLSFIIERIPRFLTL